MPASPARGQASAGLSPRWPLTALASHRAGLSRRWPLTALGLSRHGDVEPGWLAEAFVRQFRGDVPERLRIEFAIALRYDVCVQVVGHGEGEIRPRMVAQRGSRRRRVENAVDGDRSAADIAVGGGLYQAAVERDPQPDARLLAQVGIHLV